MTKSRTAVSALVLLASAGPAAAAGQTAAEARRRGSRPQVRDMVAQSCPPGARQ